MQNGVLNGVDMQIISMKSAVSDWRYIYMIPSSLYEYDISKRKITTAISLVSMMLVCFFGLGSISMWLYKPIKRAIMSLKKREGHKGNTSASVYSEKLKQYLAAGDFIACKNMAGTLYRECIGSEYCYSYVDGCFLSLLTTAARFARETVGKDDLKNLELMSDDFSTLEDVYERLEQLFELCGSKIRNTEISAEEKLIEQIKRYVLDNIETDVSQSSVAEYFNISSAHLSRVFKKVTDERFSDFVTGAKLDYAAGLLLNEPDTSVVNIAERLGYYSINYFNSLFKKKFYKTPVQYRKSN